MAETRMSIYTGHPGGGLVDVGEIRLLPGFILVESDYYNELLRLAKLNQKENQHEQ